MFNLKWAAYWRLMRFHKPVGILLLWVPTAWALWLANQGCPSFILVTYFLLGTIIMRAAGCVVNDIADRNFDKHVKRTERRPLTSGEINLSEAFIILSLLLVLALLIALQLPITCLYYAFAALFVTITYPFCKRFIEAPQLVLGLAFSMGIPMAYAASGAGPNAAMLILMLINFLWIVSYDTMYAMVDREDDLRIGVKSTAVLFADYDWLIILVLQAFFHGLWLCLALALHFSPVFYGLWVVAGGLLVFQQRLVNTRDVHKCFKAFSMNGWYGIIMWVGLMLSF